MTNPVWDDAVRRRVQHALDEACRTAADVARRYTDDSGAYAAPSEVSDGGDVHGLIASGKLQVLERLEAVCASARVEIAKVLAEVDAFQRARYGAGWQPIVSNRTGGSPPPVAEGGV